MKIFRYRNTVEHFSNNSSKGLLKKLATQFDWGSIRYSPNGKPLCANGFLSVTHCLDYLVIAYSTHDIGIDLEKIRPLKSEVIKKFDLDPENPILTWCLKEALIKLYDDKHYLFKNITHEHWQRIDLDEAYCFVVVSKEPLQPYEVIDMKNN